MLPLLVAQLKTNPWILTNPPYGHHFYHTTIPGFAITAFICASFTTWGVSVWYRNYGPGKAHREARQAQAQPQTQ